MFDILKEDISCILERDAAAKSKAEVVFLYPGFKAIRSHRIAHRLYKRGHFFCARMLSQRIAKKYGIEIHPGAEIGRRCFIDHGNGVVIGETTQIGDDVTIYQGCTLGGTGKDKGKRHPTIGNNVMVGAGARVLGPFKVGDNAKIAVGAVVLSEVPEGCTAGGVPARIARVYGRKSGLQDLDQIHIPDPISQKFCLLDKEIEKLKKSLEEVKTNADL